MQISINSTLLKALGLRTTSRSSVNRSRVRSLSLPEDGRQRRAPAKDRDQSLAPEAIIWMRKLPAHRRPTELAAAYPRICNRLALVWPDRFLTESYFNSLLLDKRPGRRGFPAKVASDLVSLQEFYVRTTTAEEAAKAWDDRMLAVGDR